MSLAASRSPSESRVKEEQIKPFLGSRIYNSKQELLSGHLGKDLKHLLQQRGVLVFPQINFTDEEQIEFTKTLGKYSPEPSSVDGSVFKVTLDKTQSTEYLKGSLYWHLDGTMNDTPILASLLSARKLSNWGGNTGFASTYAAWEQLPEARKAELDGLRVIHSVWATLLYYEPEPSLAKLEAMQRIGERELPLVWKHVDGRKSLIVGCTAQRVVNKSPMESVKIIAGLREWATSEQFSYSHAWTVGDLVMWDNTGTLHRAEAYDLDSGRMLVRTKLEGEEPIA